MKLIDTTIAFTALSLLGFGIFQHWGAVVMFCAGTLLLGFLSYLDRGDKAQINRLEKDMASLKDKMTSISLSQGLR